MYLVNTRGFKSNVPDWLVPECLARGFTPPRLRRTGNAASDRVLIHRAAGGLGDLIFMLPAVEDFIKQHPALKVTVAVPEKYHPLFAHLRAEVVDAGATFDDGSFRFIYDCLCPCGRHEEATGYRPVKNRIENFADLLGVEPRKPALRADKPLVADLLAAGELRPPFVGIVPWSARLQKDYPPELWREVCAGLARLGLNVLQIDLPPRPALGGNVRPVPGLSLDGLMSVLCHLELLITPATGPMVMAGALGVPFLALLGPTDSTMTLKYFDRYDFIQGAPLASGGTTCHLPCYYAEKNGYGSACNKTHGHCMKSITPATVVKKVESMLSSAVLDLAGQRCLCGSAARTSLGEKDGRDLFRCDSCELVRAWRIGESAYRRFYREDYGTVFQKMKAMPTYAERLQHDLTVAEKRLQKIEEIFSTA